MTREELLKTAKPILFSTPMIQTIQVNEKTETRRVIKPQPPRELQFPYGFITGSTIKKEIGRFCWTVGEICDGRTHIVKPRYQKGDILYVKETWATLNENYQPDKNGSIYVYKADHITGNDGPSKIKWRSSRFMPKAAARTFLLVKDVWPERLQDITEEGARAEGFVNTCREGEGFYTAVMNFAKYWDFLDKKREYPFELNSWVWAYRFERMEAK